MTDDYQIFEIRDDPDETFRWILLEAATIDGGIDSHSGGYPKKLEKDLFRFLSLLPESEEKQTTAPFPLFRLYAFISDSQTLALLLGEDTPQIAHNIRTAFPHTIFSGERALMENKAYVERDWQLIGLTLPGWIILFSEDVGVACQDFVEGEIRAAFLPSNEDWIARMPPEAEDPEIVSLLLSFVFNSLPERET